MFAGIYFSFNYLPVYKAVFIDMDGTMLTKSHHISPRTKEVMQQLMGRGVMIVPVSARPLHGMLHIVKDVFPADVPLVSLNGSYIYQESKIIYDNAIAPQETVLISNELQGQDVSVMYYSGMDWFASEKTELVRKEQRITPVHVTVQPFEKIISHCQQQNTGVHKILIAGKEQLILDVEEKMLSKFSSVYNICKSQPIYLEMMHASSSKLNAIRFLMNKYGISREETIAIGDNYNDAEMISFAAKGVAMGNAPDAIKKSADYITDSNNNDGVAKALEHFFELK
jgi:Cof subfamily protein (haloacid dehalogenase superfamily)